MGYFSMHNHTEFSFKDGIGHVEEMLEYANKIGLSGIAFTEHGNCFSHPYANLYSKKYPNLKVVLGVEFYEAFNAKVKDKDSKYFHLIALAKNDNGRIAINKLVTESSYPENKYFKPRVDLEMMKPYANDLIVSSACLASKLNRESDYDKCVDYVNEYKSIFPHFYLEMQSHSHEDQAKYNQKILRLSRDTNTPYIITTDSHAPNKEMLKYQGRHVQIAQDKETMSESYEGCYIQTAEEIHEIMDSQVGYEVVKKGLEETNKILDLIDDNVSVPFQAPTLPNFEIPKEFSTQTEYLTYLAENGFKKRFDNLGLSDEEIETRRKRMYYELDVIDQMGFSGYFLIVQDAVKWGKRNGVEFDDGRGSGAGSIVCYLTEITGVDPVKYNLVFERFLNPERQTLPDVDVDCHPKEKIVGYLQDKYGKKRVCQVANISYITPCVAITDVARVIDRDEERFKKYGKKIGSAKAREISKYFTEKTFEECMKVNGNEIKSRYSDEIYKELFDIASVLSNRARHTSTHAGGVGIVNTDISEYMPMTISDKGEYVIQINKKLIEDIGIVKFDFLGLATLGLIRDAVNLAKISDWELDPNNEDFVNNTKAYKLISSGKTNGVFQIESMGMKDLMVRMKPKTLEDICVGISLYRPDTMPHLENFINRKLGLEEVTYIHEDMEAILGVTQGVTAYQEQTLEIVKKFGGRSYGKADLFRRAVGKKDVELMQSEARKLYDEIIENGYSEIVAKTISDELASGGNYAFNKSHGLAYAVVCLKTAYLKANYPVEFFCAVLNSVYKDGGKVNKYILDAQEFGVEVLPPHINKSNKEFSVHDGKILFGISSINGIGDTLTDAILEERQNGKFTGIENLLDRVKLNKAQMIALIKSGALPTKNKANMILKYALATQEGKEYPEYKPVKSLPTLLELQTKWGIDTSEIKDKETRLRLYNDARKKEHDTIKKAEWVLKQKDNEKNVMQEFKEKYMQDEAFWEFEALSIFLNNNPFKELQQYITQDFYEVEEDMDCIVVGVISSIQKKKDRNKKDYAFVRVYESNGLIEGLCWNSVYVKHMDLISKGNKLAFYGTKSTDETFIVRKIKTIDEWLRDRELEKVVNL